VPDVYEGAPTPVTAFFATARMTAFMPGQSPPLVSIPILFFLFILHLLAADDFKKIEACFRIDLFYGLYAIQFK